MKTICETGKQGRDLSAYDHKSGEEKLMLNQLMSQETHFGGDYSGTIVFPSSLLLQYIRGLLPNTSSGSPDNLIVGMYTLGWKSAP